MIDRVETYESGGVVVTDGFGVTVGLQGRIGLDNLLLEGTGIGTLGSLGLGGLSFQVMNNRFYQSVESRST